MPRERLATAPLALGPRSIVYLPAPHGMATGGPEAIHQLASALQELGADARIVYGAWTDSAKGLRESIAPGGLHLTYSRYGTREADCIEDAPEHVLVLPEIWTRAADEFRHIRTAVWWLSVDNNLSCPVGRFFARPAVRPVVHLYQSQYAAAYLRSNGIRRAYPLADYLNPDHDLDGPLSDALQELGPRRDFVLFNPKKGIEVTQKLAALSASRGLAAAWVPIQDLSPMGVALLMRVAKVYVDFGPHPGMDRMPREAALAGCCVITGRRGAAGFDADVPIPARFRVPDDDLETAVYRVAECVTEFERVSAEFDPYRAWIGGQRQRFIEDVRSIFDPSKETRTDGLEAATAGVAEQR